MLKEKEIEESLKNNKKIKNKLTDKIPKFNNSEKNLKNKKYSEMEEMEFINEDKEEKIQQQIFNQYMNSQRRKVELYIKNEREKR